MWKLEVSAEDLGRSWRWSHGRWRAGASCLVPLAHPAVESYSLTDGRRRVFVARERLAGQPPPASGRVSADEYDAALVTVAGWPGETATIEAAASRLEVTAGRWGTAPLYLHAGRGEVRGSWDICDLYPHASGALNGLEVARALAMWRRYSTDTVFADIHQLTAGAAAIYTPTNGLALTYPAPVPHSRARKLADGADPVAAVGELLAQAVNVRPMAPAGTAVELSGGMDSANLALSLAEGTTVPAVASAMIMPDEPGRQQAARRAEFIARTGYPRDVRVDAESFPPLCPGGDRAKGEPVSPYAEPFSEATTALLARVAAAGVHTVYTGIGGDEMLAAQPGERFTEPHPPSPPSWVGPTTRDALADVDTNTAPATAVSEPTLMAFACRGPLFLAAGLWPVSPLADPRLITFGEWLPRTWRADKRLFRERLARAGLSPGFVRPRLRENFAPLMEKGLRCHGVALLRQLLTDGCVLADAGYVDSAALYRECDRIDAGATDLDRSLYEVLAVELAVRAAMT